MKKVHGFSLIEIIIAIAILAIISALVLTAFRSNVQQRDAIRTFKNMQFMHVTIQQMRLDNLTNGGAIRWTASNNLPLTYVQWTNLIVQGKYLTIEQLDDHLQKNSAENEILPIAVTESDLGDTVILVTKNWPGQTAASSNGLTSGDYGYFRKDGVGMPPQHPTGETNKVGTGGQFHYQPLR